MTIPSNPRLSDLAAEYGHSLPYQLSDFLGYPGAPTEFPASLSDWEGLSAGGGGSLSVSVSPSSVSGNCGHDTGESCSAQTTAASCAVSGGSGPITYLWERVSGDTFTINSPSASITTFSVLGGNETKSGTYRCTVTRGGDSDSDTVTVSTTHTDIS